MEGQVKKKLNPRCPVQHGAAAAHGQHTQNIPAAAGNSTGQHQAAALKHFQPWNYFSLIKSCVKPQRIK